MGHARKEQITIFPTNRCNMRCIYCAADSASHQDNTQKININFAKKGISDYFNDKNHHQIRYYSSGEPTQAMDVVSETWDFAYHIVGDRLLSEMQSNCLFDSNTLKWVADHIDYLWASVDGWPAIQNHNRPTEENEASADKVISNILTIKEKTFVGIRATITKETVNRQVELVEYFHSLGFRHLCSEPVFSPVKNDIQNPGKISGISLVEYIENFIEAWHVARKLDMTYINSFMVNFDEKVEYACRACLPTPHLTTDGFVSACDLGFYGETPLTDLIYGKYDEENDKIVYFQDAIDKLRTRKCANMPSCKTCFAKKYCGGGCLGRAYHETRDFYGVIPEFCWATRYLAKNIPINQVHIPYLHP